MKGLRFAAAALLALFPGAAFAGEDVLAGKNLDELLKDVESRIAERKEDVKVRVEYVSFEKREEARLSKFGDALARSSAAVRTQECIAYILHAFEMYKPSLEILTKLKLAYSKNARDFMRLQDVYIYMAWNYVYLDRPSEADSIMNGMLSRGQGFRTKIEEQLAKMQKFPEARKAIQEAFDRRDLAPRDENRQWELCQILSQRAFYPVKERIELSWMEKNFQKSAAVQNGELEWLLILNSEKLMDYAGVLRDIANFVKNKKNKDFWAVNNGDSTWLSGDAHMNLGRWKDAIACFEQLKLKYPKHQKVETGRAEALVRYAQTKDKAKSKPDPLPADWGRGL